MNKPLETPALTQPIKYPGGKHYLAPMIVGLMPPDHIHYVEPYFGGGSVLLDKNPEGISEVVNDVDSDLTNFWAVLRDEATFNSFRRRLVKPPHFPESVFKLGDDGRPDAGRGYPSVAVLRSLPTVSNRVAEVVRHTLTIKGPACHERASLGVADGCRRACRSP